MGETGGYNALHQGDSKLEFLFWPCYQLAVALWVTPITLLSFNFLGLGFSFVKSLQDHTDHGHSENFHVITQSLIHK